MTESKIVRPIFSFSLLPHKFGSLMKHCSLLYRFRDGRNRPSTYPVLKNLSVTFVIYPQNLCSPKSSRTRPTNDSSVCLQKILNIICKNGNISLSFKILKILNNDIFSCYAPSMLILSAVHWRCNLWFHLSFQGKKPQVTMCRVLSASYHTECLIPKRIRSSWSLPVIPVRVPLYRSAGDTSNTDSVPNARKSSKT